MARALWIGLTAIAFASCSRHENALEPREAASAINVAPPASAPSIAPVDASPLPESAPTLTSAFAADASDASIDAGMKKYSVVLHAGDSMVGGNGGLTKALEAKFKAAGARFVSDSAVSISIGTYDRSNRLKNLLDRNKPDLVILTLGTNDVFVPFPQSLATNIESIVKRIGNRECYWIGPPTWKPDTGIVAVIRDHAAPCKFFDSSHLKIQRAGDGIHPTNEGGVEWAEQFWQFLSNPSPRPTTP